MQSANSLALFISNLRSRRGMFLPPTSTDCYPQIVAALIGFDQATQGGSLAGFREWLVVKVDGLSNMAWFAIIDAEISSRGITAAEDKIAFLFDLIQEYLADRDQKGVGNLFYQYYDWCMKRKSMNKED